MLEPITLGVVCVAGFVAKKALDHVGESAAEAAASRLGQLVRSVGDAMPGGSPIEPASVECFVEASRYLHRRLGKELGVKRLRRRRAASQWCAAYRGLIDDRSLVVGFLTEVDPGPEAPDASLGDLIGASFNRSYLRWLRRHNPEDEPALVEDWVIGGIPDRSAARAPMSFYELYIGIFAKRYHDDSELRMAVDTVRKRANTAKIEATIEAVPESIVDKLERRRAHEVEHRSAEARRAHLHRTISSNESFKLPLNDRRGVAVWARIDELYLDLPLEAPPGSIGWRDDGPAEPEVSHQARVTQGRLDAPPAGTMPTSYDDASSVSVATCLDRQPRMLITGGPGSGKSGIVRFLAWHYARASAGQGTAAGRSGLAGKLPARDWVPIVIRCKALDQVTTHQSLQQLIAVQLRADGEVARDDVESFSQELVHLARTGGALVLVDGLDEAHDDVRLALADVLHEETDAHPSMPIVITSRHTGIASVAPLLRSTFDHYEIAALTPADQARFIGLWAAVAERTGAGRGLADDLIRQLEGADELSRLGEFIQPLTLMAQLYQRKGELPERRDELYRRAVSVLIRSRDRDLMVNDVWPEMTHLAHQMHDADVMTWGLRDAARAVDEYLHRAREFGLESIIERPLPPNGEHWMRDAVRLAILNESGWAPPDEFDDDGSGTRVEFCHLAFREFCAADAFVAGYGVVARG